MDDPKPQEKKYYEGPEAVHRFEGIVKQAISVTPRELKKRDEAWRKEKKSQKAKAR